MSDTESVNKSAETHARQDREILTYLRSADGPTPKGAIVSATGLAASAVTAGLARLRSGDSPAVAMDGNKRGAKYRVA